MEFYIAQAISIINGILAVIMMQFKSMKKILIFQIICNLLTASTYFLLGGFSGAGICIIAIVQTFVMFAYNVKKIKPHFWVIVTFVAFYLGCSAIYFKGWVDIFSSAGAICYAFSVVQQKSSASRLWYLFNPLFWMVYDLCIEQPAYGNFALHLVVFASTLIGILRNDIKKRNVNISFQNIKL